ncbi:hypothetical protein [Nocardioides conyzicola]|uniref:Uncharacterized protein n=1 Tax=Nocardioides conyzicola TaxID=1651781 RepID=A0ABP8Y0Z0_9ACTN
MPDNQYPVFESGQTLTAPDLNTLRAFLHERDRLVGRMIGFGINAGLAGSVSGSTLTIEPGLAIDQYGEPLVLTAAQTITLPPTTVTPSYDFIATGPGGFSVVLEASETVNPAPACGEADCAGHAEHHTRDVTLRVVNGRVTGTVFDFPNDPLLSVEPVRVALDSSPANSFDDLQTALVGRLTNAPGPAVIRTDLISKLAGVHVLGGDTPAVKGYKCGWLNMVLFATLDLLRTESLLRLTVDRDPARAGVVVGWVEQVLGTWVFHCGYRHAWQPPRGFTEAFLGGTCGDPAGLFRDRLEALIDGYAPPDPPVQGNPPQPPVLCPAGWIRVNGTCRPVYPPVEVDPTWLDPWVVFDPIGPIWQPPIEEPDWLVDPADFYGQPPLDFYGDGLIGGWQYVGQPGVDVEGVLNTYLDDRGFTADIKVVSHAEAQGLDGYLPSSAFSPADTIVLSVNQAGNVVATGRVPATYNSRQVSTALPAAQAAVAEAQEAVVTLQGLTEGVRSDFTQLQGSFSTLEGSFTTLQGQFADYRGGQFDQSGFGVRINTLEQDLKGIEDVTERLAKLEGKVDVIGTRGLTAGGGKVIDATIGRGISEFTETAVAAVRAIGKDNRQLERYVKDVERAHARFEVDVNTEDPRLIGASTLDVLKSMRTMVKSALKDTPEAATIGSQLDAQIRDIQLLIG